MAQRTKEEKIELTAQLAKRLGEANVLYLADFTGLNVKKMTELRRRFREAGVRFIVVKNRLALRALQELDLPDITEHLRGPTGFILGSDDPVGPAKTVRDFAKENDQRPTLKVGVVERRIVTPKEINQLAALPGREELLSGIVGSLSAPAAGIVRTLGALLRDLAYMVEEVARKNADGGGQPGHT